MGHRFYSVDQIRLFQGIMTLRLGAPSGHPTFLGGPMDEVLNPVVPFKLLTDDPGQVFLSRFKDYLPNGTGRRSPP